MKEGCSVSPWTGLPSDRPPQTPVPVLGWSRRSGSAWIKAKSLLSSNWTQRKKKGLSQMSSSSVSDLCPRKTSFDFGSVVRSDYQNFVYNSLFVINKTQYLIYYTLYINISNDCNFSEPVNGCFPYFVVPNHTKHCLAHKGFALRIVRIIALHNYPLALARISNTFSEKS